MQTAETSARETQDSTCHIFENAGSNLQYWEWHKWRRNPSGNPPSEHRVAVRLGLGNKGEKAYEGSLIVKE